MTLYRLTDTEKCKLVFELNYSESELKLLQRK